jgi:hypothetical protein
LSKSPNSLFQAIFWVDMGASPAHAQSVAGLPLGDAINDLKTLCAQRIPSEGPFQRVGETRRLRFGDHTCVTA